MGPICVPYGPRVDMSTGTMDTLDSTQLVGNWFSADQRKDEAQKQKQLQNKAVIWNTTETCMNLQSPLRLRDDVLLSL